MDNEMIARMISDQNAAASAFWAYPDAEWQAIFQAKWLTDRGFPATITVDGRTWGALD